MMKRSLIFVFFYISLFAQAQDPNSLLKCQSSSIPEFRIELIKKGEMLYAEFFDNDELIKLGCELEDSRKILCYYEGEHRNANLVIEEIVKGRMVAELKEEWPKYSKKFISKYNCQ